MIAVEDALARVLALVGPTGAETVPLRDAAGRHLAAPLRATRDQPPFDAATMDGYAIPDAAAGPGARFRVIGEAAAGHPFDGAIGPGEAARIFTGAALPPGAARVVMQEDVARDGDGITLSERVEPGPFIRPAGCDFTAGTAFAPAHPLRPGDIALIASMGHPTVPVRRRPEVALIATGDELVQPGETPGPGQIVASNGFGLAAMIERAGGIARLLPVARDTEASLSMAFDLARGADLVVTIGGASVGDHDLVARVAETRGMERAFYKVAMRPGKPLMAGRVDGTPMIGLPGNPVSSMVCGVVFILPAIRVMLGGAPSSAARRPLPLAAALEQNGPREHYMRARITPEGVAAFDRQDSSLLSVLAQADALIVRPPHDRARDAGDMVEVVDLASA
ncbi:molybdopterin molybdotransferase MoeA [Palleronia sediminis]|uniref:Molybdopterin molybdenumtransferase n=1 Tax=Palleronia sediminis TaxID=2547833 RepID=A0A4R6ALI8_9RHOB|nr:gephyrin-like molybdotransferase Glp [Palleronia sediminis]TDL84114.1 molybdopterin molybdotransferase MoeA [Palleronia sediminis]